MMSPTAVPAGHTKVWDPLVRLFHWSLVICVVIAWLSGESEESGLWLHVYVGYVIGGLVGFRVLWGIIGSRHARFTDFVFPPRQVLAYARDALRGRSRRYLGHNPLGGAMVVALLGMLALATITGIALYGVEDQAGPLAGFLQGSPEFMEDVLEETHEVFSNTALALVILHVLGVLWSSWLHQENLVRAMINGHKRANP